MYDSEHIRGSPFVCHVYDANLVRVYGLDVGVVGQELKFNVNTSNAGRGDIQVRFLFRIIVLLFDTVWCRFNTV